MISVESDFSPDSPSQNVAENYRKRVEELSTDVERTK